MAQHIDEVADIAIPAVSRAEFIAQLRTGDILMFSGQEPISIAIERETKSPWSHVGYVWLPLYIEPLFIESVFPNGVRVSRLLSTYIGGAYDGDIVLCRRPIIPADGIEAIIARAISRLGLAYDWQSEVEQAAHNLIPFLPEHATNNELYCSGEVQLASTAWSPALQRPNPKVMPSPEDIWTDPTVLPLAKLLKGAS